MLHSLNLRLFPEQLVYIAHHGGDEVPLGATGKIDNKLLRQRLTGYRWPFDATVTR